MTTSPMGEIETVAWRYKQKPEHSWSGYTEKDPEEPSIWSKGWGHDGHWTIWEALVLRSDALERIAQLEADARRYRILRRGQRWSVIDGIGDTLRAEVLDAAIDAAMGTDGEKP